MDAKTWDAAILKLFEYYRVEKLPTESQQNLWYESVKHIGNVEVDQVIAGITGDFDSLPRNIPKAFIGHRPSSAAHGRQVQYDPIEDLRFPISKLWDTFNVLETKGYAAFQTYCDFVHMPRNDRDRVVTKYKVILGQLKLPSIRAKLASIGRNVGPPPSADKEAQRRNNIRMAAVRQPGEEG